jgi:hypothetical protein
MPFLEEGQPLHGAEYSAPLCQRLEEFYIYPFHVPPFSGTDSFVT